MKITFMNITILVLWFSSMVLLVPNPGIAAGRSNHADLLKLPEVSQANAEIPRVLAVLENKVADPQLLETAKKKLLTLDRKETRLLSSLCDRITDQGQSAGSDVAFLVMTILMVLS